MRTVSGWPVLLSSLCNRRWRRIFFSFFFPFLFFLVFFSLIRSAVHQRVACCSRRQIDAKNYTEQVLHHLVYFISPLVDLCSNSSRTRLPSHHLTANRVVCCYSAATGFAAGASFVRLRSDCASLFFAPFTSSSVVRFVFLFDLPLAIFFSPSFTFREDKTHILGSIIISIRQPATC